MLWEWYLHEFLRCILLEERRVSDWLQDVVEHQIGCWNQRTLGVRRVVRQVRRLGAIVNSMTQK